jgi:hypothetical protein
MMHLNIIPAIQKKEIKIKQIYDSLKNLFSVVFIVAVAYSSFFMIMRSVILNYFVSTIENSTVLTRSTENYSKKVADINNQVDSIKMIQGDFVTWSSLLEHLRLLQPEEISIEKILLSKKDNNATIGGTAKTRDSLLKFKENLEESGYFGDFSLPIKDLLQKNNVSFSMSLNIKNYEFK